MGLRKTLLSILAGVSMLIPTKANSAVIDVPVYEYGADVQGAIDSASSGDTINLIRGDYSSLDSGNWNVDGKSLTFTSTDGILVRNNSANGLINIVNGSSVDLEGLNLYQQYAGAYLINVNDTSSLVVNNNLFANGIGYINYSASGGLTATGNSFQGTEYTTQGGITLNSTSGTINIDKNFFGWIITPITINGDTALRAKQGKLESALNSDNVINILNNTMSVAYGNGIAINGIVTSTGYIANNNISQTPDAIIGEQNASGLIVDHNNFWENQTLMKALKYNITSSGVTNYTFDPALLLVGYSDKVDPSSPLYNKGLYIEGLTTWFENADKTYIGSYGADVQAIPEASTRTLVGMGSLIGYALLRRKHHE